MPISLPLSNSHSRSFRLGLPSPAILVFAAVWLFGGPGAAWARYDAGARAILYYQKADPRTVLQSLAEQLAMEPPPEYRGDPAKKIDINARDVTLQEALDRIAQAAGYSWWRTNDDKYIVGDANAYEEAKRKGEVAREPSRSAAAQSPAGGAETAPLPPPVEEEPKVTAVFNQGKIEQVAMAISQQAGIRISLEGKTAGLRVDVIAKDQPLTEVLDMIASPKGLVWWKKADGSYGMADKAYYEQTVLPESAIQRIFRPNHIKAEDFEKAIKGVLTPKIGKVAVDPRTNKVIVTDLPPVIEMIERLLQEIDVQLVTRVFQIHYADVEDMAKQIEDYKSGPGTIKVDPKTHQIIVTDLLQNILRMEKLIDVLDVGPEIVVYDVNNIGLDGDDLKNLQDIIESVRTKDLMFETNEVQGTFILEDVPEVHDKVEKILKAFDQPIKQVLIEAEVLTTTYSRDFTYSLNWTYSEDLFSAAADKLVALPGTPGGDASINGGYRNLGETFPLFTNTGGGLTVQNLSKEALIRLQTALSNKTTNVLLQPQILVKNMETANIRVGGEEPYLTTLYNNYNTNVYGQSSTTQNTVPFGLELEITPSISPNGLIEMEVVVSDNDATPFDFNAGGNIGNVRLIRTDNKDVNTVLIIPSGETRMIGGLLRENKSRDNTGIPFLSEIPLIGPLFGSYSKKDGKSNLMIFLTPTIVEERGTYAVSKEGRRGRALTLEEVRAEEDQTTPTLLDAETGQAAVSYEAESDTLRRGGTLSDESAADQMPYLLGQGEADAEQAEGKRPRTTSYTSPVGSPVGSLTDVTGAVTSTGPSQEPGQEPSDMPPEGPAEQVKDDEPPPQQESRAGRPPQPTPAPAKSETDY